MGLYDAQLPALNLTGGTPAQAANQYGYLQGQQFPSELVFGAPTQAQPQGYLQGMKQFPSELTFGTQGQPQPQGFFQGLKQEGMAAWDGMSGAQQLGTIGQVGMGLFNAYNTWSAAKEQTKLQKGQLALQKGTYDNNVRLTNSALEDRQRRRVDTSNGRAEGVDSYMSRNRAN